MRNMALIEVAAPAARAATVWDAPDRVGVSASL